MTPELPEMGKLFVAAGFTLIETEKYFIKDDLQDHFLYSNKYRPGRYLSAEVRNNTSAFSAFSDPQEVEDGVAKLASDIASGKVQEVIRSYENEHGDYLFFIAEKRD